jgi:hypothetical protein
MAVTVDLSYKFASLVKQLQESPGDPVLKQAVVSKIPDMMALAKVNPLAQYRLAQIHSPSSFQYKQMMRQSANMGCTNAMLAICEVLLKPDSPASADLLTAAHYMKMIENSKDTFILEQSKFLIASKSELAALMKTTTKTDCYNSDFRFFTRQPEEYGHSEVENQNQLTKNQFII